MTPQERGWTLTSTSTFLHISTQLFSLPHSSSKHKTKPTTPCPSNHTYLQVHQSIPHPLFNFPIGPSSIQPNSTSPNLCHLPIYIAPPSSQSSLFSFSFSSSFIFLTSLSSLRTTESKTFSSSPVTSPDQTQVYLTKI
eukprot:TRINITY_DN8028_c0_g3_i1.p2 TRINITY_DN8028_c0_g3~~TRINITY_DN8028_c0_g3_i1.p2  ORF type:complete len:138 (-),score=10.66 TRINITY_DN8028_c0_g3_i1:710-1123(-)